MSAPLPLAVCRVRGVRVARFAKPAGGIVPGINCWLLTVTLPALVLKLMPVPAAVVVASMCAGRMPQPMIIAKSILTIPALVAPVVAS